MKPKNKVPTQPFSARSNKGELTKAYGFNPTTGQQGLWSTDPIWQANIAEHQLTSEHTRYHYLHTDHLYTPMLVTDATGDISWKAVQEAFGAINALQHQSRINMNLRFPGLYYDQETGTHYNFQRDYKPNAGRYVQSDPIGLEAGVNIYSYVESSPILKIDSTGLVRWSAQTIGGARGYLLFSASGDLMRFSSTCKNGNPCIVYTIVITIGVGGSVTPFGGAVDVRGSTYIDKYDESSPSSIGGVAVKLGCQAVLGRQLGALMLTVVGSTENVQTRHLD